MDVDQLGKGSNGGNPTTAIIIPVHNGKTVLRRALRSLLSQTVQDFEVVVVSDDGFDYFPLAQSVMGERVRQVHTPVPGSGPAIAREIGCSKTCSFFCALSRA